MHSSSINQLQTRRSSTRFSDRYFSVAGPRPTAWNSVPDQFKNGSSLETFHLQFNTYVFKVRVTPKDLLTHIRVFLRPRLSYGAIQIAILLSLNVWKSLLSHSSSSLWHNLTPELRPFSDPSSELTKIEPLSIPPNLFNLKAEKILFRKYYCNSSFFFAALGFRILNNVNCSCRIHSACLTNESYDPIMTFTVNRFVLTAPAI